ncbi:MAG: YcjX family protein [Bauldia sp.]
MPLTSFADEARIAVTTLAERIGALRGPTVRLGVTGLSRAGKTVFITALVHNLIHGGRLPLFKAYSSGRVTGAALEPQPDDAVPRFDYEAHVADMVEQRTWPESTYRISELRLTISYESATFLGRNFGRGRLNVDIVDYPGEWLLDLPLLAKDFSQWSAETIARAEDRSRHGTGDAWLGRIRELAPNAPADEMLAKELAGLFTDYLRACRDDRRSPSTLPPGRFLMPGDLEGSPALTFSPLIGDGADAGRRSLYNMMARRYEAYKSVVVKPFFREHFTRLDRQIVLVDALQALNAGPAALRDLEVALTEILACFRPGRSNFLSRILSRRIDRILLAATKADHLHHRDHDRLEAILTRLLARVVERVSIEGAGIEAVALASVRATKEGTVVQSGERLPSIIGTPLKGETLNGETFDGATEVALFPGDLPDDPAVVFEAVDAEETGKKRKRAAPVRFMRFRPPPLERTAEGLTLSLPHIRLDRALEYLLGDRLA